MRIRFLLMLALATTGCFATTASEPTPTPSDKAVITLNAMLGKVTFTHSKHASMEGVTCKTCHHKTTEKAPPAGCGTCHTDVTPPTRKDALHTNCGGCHDKATGASGPKTTDCMGCHVPN